MSKFEVVYRFTVIKKHTYHYVVLKCNHYEFRVSENISRVLKISSEYYRECMKNIGAKPNKDFDDMLVFDKRENVIIAKELLESIILMKNLENDINE